MALVETQQEPGRLDGKARGLTQRVWPVRLAYLRDLLRELVVRDVKLRYKRSVLGIVWSLLLPLCQLLVITFVFRRVIRLDIDHYPSFVFSGLLPWTWFMASVTAATGAITDNRELVRRPGFPIGLLPIVPVASNFIHFALALPILVLFVAVAVGPMRIDLLALPAVIAVQFLFAVGLGYVLATVQVSFRDTQHLLTVLLQLWFYLTPIFYNRQLVPPRFEVVYQLNPMVHILDGYRSVLLDTTTFPIFPLLGVAVAAASCVWFGRRLFRRASHAFAEEL